MASQPWSCSSFAVSANSWALDGCPSWISTQSWLLVWSCGLIGIALMYSGSIQSTSTLTEIRVSLHSSFSELCVRSAYAAPRACRAMFEIPCFPLYMQWKKKIRSFMSEFQMVKCCLDKPCAVVPEQKAMLRWVYILVYYGSIHLSYTLANGFILSTLTSFRSQLGRMLL